MQISDDLKRVPDFDTLKEVDQAEKKDVHEVLQELLDKNYEAGNIDEESYWRMKNDPREAMNNPGLTMMVSMNIQMREALQKRAREKVKAFLN